MAWLLENIVVESEMGPKSSEGGLQKGLLYTIHGHDVFALHNRKQDDLLTLRWPRNSATINEKSVSRYCVKAYWTLRHDVHKGEMCGSDKVTRVMIPLVTWSALEGDESEKVAKTNVWVKIKRNGEYLQRLEDNSKEIKEEMVCQATRTFEHNRLQTKSGLRPNSRI